MPLSKVEALEWAADYAERTKLFEIPPVSARDRFEIIDSLAEAALLGQPPEAPKVITYSPDATCIEYMQYLTEKLRNASGISTKDKYRRMLNEHLDALRSSSKDEPHPSHRREPEAVQAEAAYDEPVGPPSSRKKTY